MEQQIAGFFLSLIYTLGGGMWGVYEKNRSNGAPPIVVFMIFWPGLLAALFIIKGLEEIEKFWHPPEVKELDEQYDRICKNLEDHKNVLNNTNYRLGATESALRIAIKERDDMEVKKDYYKEKYLECLKE